MAWKRKHGKRGQRGEVAARDIPKAQQQLFDEKSSPRQKYAALVVGRTGLGALLAHEFVALVAQNRAGALGLALRKALYPWILGRCGKNVVFGQNVVLRHPHKVRIADNVVIDDCCLLDAKGDANEGITIGSGVFIGRNTILSCKNGDIEIGDGANIGFNCEVFSAGRVVVGAKTLIAAYSYIVGGDHEFGDPTKPIHEQGRVSRGVQIGEGAWIGAGVTVLDGARVGAHAIIGAGTVVRGDVPDHAVVAALRSKIIGSRAASG
ncbi:MAG: DapH/DapD/GlmU-related protein [Vicinamibacterales bacterium]